MARGNSFAVQNFVPKDYYELFMKARDVSLEKYPYYVRDYDPSFRKTMTFAVFDIKPYTVNGQATRSFTIVYKSLKSKSFFERIIYQ